MKRCFLIVLDGFGIGEAPDAEQFGDNGANTLGTISKNDILKTEMLNQMGLFNIDGVSCGKKCDAPIASYGRLRELSAGKDTTIGHWEIAGIVSSKPLPTFPDGFPPEIIKKFEEKTGRKVLCNKPASGTKVLKIYGKEHMETGSLIVYTSADSVFQIAAHEDIIPVEQLYEYCKIARELFTGEYAVGRVIARPFVGTCPDDFVRTPRRHDFSLLPPERTLLDELHSNGKSVYSVGKINDIFAGQGIDKSIPTICNTNGMYETLNIIKKEEFDGLCFVNLVDTDMQYGHRRDIDGYAAAITEFDTWLKKAYTFFNEDDLLIITGDHGCDPGFKKTTDHTREYIPVLIYQKGAEPVNFGTVDGFAFISDTIKNFFNIKENDT